jgi:hypothetical protein
MHGGKENRERVLVVKREARQPTAKPKRMVLKLLKFILNN